MMAEKEFPKRVHPRLRDKEIYSLPGSIVHVIVCTKDKQKYFTNEKLAKMFCEVLISAAKEFKNKVYAYCVMPDHVHILLEPSVEMGIVEFVKCVKGRYRTWCRKNGMEIEFQKSFYDHVLRKEEDVLQVARYILENPIRRGLANELGEYPFGGSLEFKI